MPRADEKTGTGVLPIPDMMQYCLQISCSA